MLTEFTTSCICLICIIPSLISVISAIRLSFSASAVASESLSSVAMESSAVCSSACDMRWHAGIMASTTQHSANNLIVFIFYVG